MKLWKKIKIKKNIDESGVLSVIEKDEHVDFDIKRVFFVSGVSGNDSRGKHAHKELKQVILSVSGKFKLVLDNGEYKEEFILEQGGDAIYVEGPVWRTMYEFTPDATMMVLCDRIYKDDIVVRNYSEFLGLSSEK